MIVFPSDKIAYVDVDDTLILWNPTQEQLDKDGIPFKIPQGSADTGTAEIETSPSGIGKIVPHKAHVEQIKKHKLRGHGIVVWSAGGAAWAEAAVRALGLTPYVDLVLCKPVFVYDDLPSELILPKSQWMENK